VTTPSRSRLGLPGERKRTNHRWVRGRGGLLDRRAEVRDSEQTRRGERRCEVACSEHRHRWFGRIGSRTDPILCRTRGRAVKPAGRLSGVRYQESRVCVSLAGAGAEIVRP